MPPKTAIYAEALQDNTNEIDQKRGVSVLFDVAASRVELEEDFDNFDSADRAGDADAGAYRR